MMFKTIWIFFVDKPTECTLRLHDCLKDPSIVMQRRHYTALTLNVNIGPQLGWTLNGYERGKLKAFNVNGVNIETYR